MVEHCVRLSTQADFIRGFDNTVGRPRILRSFWTVLAEPSTRMDSISASKPQTSSRIPPTQSSTVLLETVFNKDGTGTLTVETAVGDGFAAVHVLEGTLDFEASQTLDTLVIDAGAIVTISSLASPPSPADDGGLAAASSPDNEHAESAAGAGGGVQAGGVQAVPEPGALSLLTLGLFSLLARRPRANATEGLSERKVREAPQTNHERPREIRGRLA
jgi:hypothetical protein